LNLERAVAAEGASAPVDCRWTVAVPTRNRVWAEFALVFAVFLIQGAYPVPEVNEPYYLGKAIHFWNRDWAAGDFFLQTADAHYVFYFTFGWLSLLLPPLALAWCGRLLTWALLAWAWRRLCWAIMPRPYWSVLAAALFVAALDQCHMAGEWVVGGVEAKGFAFVFVFLAFEAIARDRWGRAGLMLGAATAFHVLVGGWATIAAVLAWCLGRAEPRSEEQPDDQAALRPRATLLCLAGGALLALAGIVPVLLLNRGAEPETVRAASQVYVFDRLYHHLDPRQMPPAFVFRFLLLAVAWFLLVWLAPATPAARRLRRLAAAVLLIAGCGGVIGMSAAVDRAAAAGLLRLYWFRLADVVMPLAVAIEMTAFVAWGRLHQRPAARWWFAAAVVLAAAHLGVLGASRPIPRAPRADKGLNYVTWRDACNWIAASPDLPADARFLTPRQAATFKWYTGRAEVVNWKEIPQDAAGIVAWWARLKDIYGAPDRDGEAAWLEWPGELPPARLLALAQKYEFRYVVTARPNRLRWRPIYANYDYAVYDLAGPLARTRKPAATQEQLPSPARGRGAGGEGGSNQDSKLFSDDHQPPPPAKQRIP
jgi:hypothetical protein